MVKILSIFKLFKCPTLKPTQLQTLILAFWIIWYLMPWSTTEALLSTWEDILHSVFCVGYGRPVMEIRKKRLFQIIVTTWRNVHVNVK